MTDDERTHSPFQILCNHRPADETFVHAREFSPPFKKKILTPFPLPTPNSPNGHVFGLYPPGGRETEERKRMGKRKNREVAARLGCAGRERKTWSRLSICTFSAFSFLDQQMKQPRGFEGGKEEGEKNLW